MDSYFNLKLAIVEEALNKLIPEQNNAQNASLFSAARYSLFGGGKRLRPVLALATAEMLGAHEKSALSAACALELIHTYSLIHDDLPCMDNDDFRRGKPTLHKVVSEGHAVLAGDFLLTSAFEAIADEPSLTDKQKVKLIALLSKASGGNGMIGGQIMDLEAEGKQLSLEQLSTIHSAKTGAMLAASLEAGGIAANAADEVLKTLRECGYQLGLAFQIIDDVLDVTASSQKHGKTIASDVINQKATFISLLGVEKSENMAESLLLSSIEKFKLLPCNTESLEMLAKTLVYRKS